jgi:omega-hydroxy-beta-dihydromenaquinone-9 sulfotransferase
MAHPLSGADLGTLARAFRAGGRPDRLGTAAAIWGAALARAPVSALEALAIAPLLPATDDLPPPVFILGHWRSGTTHLYNTMSRDAGWAHVPPIPVGLPWDMFGIARALRPMLERALPEHRWIDRIPVTPTSPQEDEVAIASMTDLSFYHGIYFPRRFDALIDRGLFFDGVARAESARWERRFTYFLRKLSLAQGGRPLLVKNPVYTGRIARLRRLFPGARFIHIHRDPAEVFVSMRNFYRKLLGVLALQDVPDELNVDATILRVYDRMMTRFVRESRHLPDGTLVELPYAELDRDPLGAVAFIYESLGLEGFDAARPAFEAYLASVRDYPKNAFGADPATVALVERNWGGWIERWGYGAPAEPAAHAAP